MKLGLCLVCALAAGFAQTQPASHEGEARWEVGVNGGYGFSPDLTVKGPAGSASTGIRPGGAIGVFGGEDTYNYFSGEARYLYRFSNLKLSSGGTSVDFGAHTHIAEGAILAHFRPRASHIRPFISFGGGIKVLQGTGIESAAQPLGRLAALTATREVLPTADAGFGVKVNFRQHVRLRFEVRDYISGSPGKVIAPAPGASLTGIMNDIIGLAGLSYTW